MPRLRLPRCLVLAVLALFAAACSAPAPTASQPSGVVSQQGQSNAGSVTVRFALYTGTPGFRLPEDRRDLSPGDSAVVGTTPVDLDVVAGGLPVKALLQSLAVEGAVLSAEPRELSDQVLGLRVGPGRDGDQVTISVTPPGGKPAVLTLRRAEPASVQVSYDSGDGWQAVTTLASHVSAGPAAVKLGFSKPVRQAEVEQALSGGQGAFVRGLMQWQDEQTLIWSLPQLPPRLDFLLGGAHDADGRPLPGGIISLRTGAPPELVSLDLAAQREDPVTVLPPDVASASLSRDGLYINLAAWRPGTSRWDWQTGDWYLPVADPVLKPGRMEGPQPRLIGDLESWVSNPGGTLVAGFRRPQASAAAPAGTTDLVVRDLRGGREQVIRSFATQSGPAGAMHYLAWSADGMKILALSDTVGGLADMVVFDFATLQKVTVVQGLTLQAAGTRLAWAPDGQWVLAGSLLVDLQSGTHRVLPGGAVQARGAWEPGGARLLYTAQDWSDVLLVEPAGGEPLSLGPALLVDWSGKNRLFLVRWPASDSRYVPPGE